MDVIFVNGALAREEWGLPSVGAAVWWRVDDSDRPWFRSIYGDEVAGRLTGSQQEPSLSSDPDVVGTVVAVEDLWSTKRSEVSPRRDGCVLVAEPGSGVVVPASSRPPSDGYSFDGHLLTVRPADGALLTERGSVGTERTRRIRSGADNVLDLVAALRFEEALDDLEGLRGEAGGGDDGMVGGLRALVSSLAGDVEQARFLLDRPGSDSGFHERAREVLVREASLRRGAVFDPSSRRVRVALLSGSVLVVDRPETRDDAVGIRCVDDLAAAFVGSLGRALVAAGAAGFAWQAGPGRASEALMRALRSLALDDGPDDGSGFEEGRRDGADRTATVAARHDVRYLTGPSPGIVIAASTDTVGFRTAGPGPTFLGVFGQGWGMRRSTSIDTVTMQLLDAAHTVEPDEELVELVRWRLDVDDVDRPL